MHFSFILCTVIVHFYYICSKKYNDYGYFAYWIDNTNLAYVLGHESTDIGNIRETFFYNQMRVTTDVISSRISDFEIDGKTFEVGGKSKKQKQIQNVAQGYVVKDDIETGHANIIPLWQFGLTY